MNAPPLSQRRLGTAGPMVSAISLGCMGMSGMYGASDDAESIATIHAALDAGINLIDTGDFYGMGHNELLIAQAIADRRHDILLSVKFGALRSPTGAWTGFDSRPNAIKNFIAYSLVRLRTDHIDIYRPARLDPQVPIEDTIGAIADLVKAGYVRYIGLSEVGPDTIRRAHAVHPVCDLQIEYSLISRGIETHILPVLRELGIGVTAYGVLSRGLLAGSLPAGKTDFRSFAPRFQSKNLDANRKLVDALAAFAAGLGATPSELAIAWALGKGDDIVPVLGSRKLPQLEQAIRAATIHLTTEQLATLEEIVNPQLVSGTRYDAAQMRMLDSEKAPA